MPSRKKKGARAQSQQPELALANHNLGEESFSADKRCPRPALANSSLVEESLCSEILMHSVDESYGVDVEDNADRIVVGTVVQCYGLQGAMSTLNGSRGKVVEFLDALSAQVDLGPPHGSLAVPLEHVSKVTGPIIKGNDAETILKDAIGAMPANCILQVPTGTWNWLKREIENGCHIVGTPGGNSVLPCLVGQLVINLRDEDDVVELEGVEWKEKLPINAILCKRGKLHMRHCKITARGAGIGIGGAGFQAEARLDSCQIEGCGEGGFIVAGKDACATLTNCSINSNRCSGVEVRDGAQAVMKKCTFHRNGHQALVGWCKARSIKVSLSTFKEHSKESSILIADQCHAKLSRCIIDGSGFAAVAVEAASATLNHCLGQRSLHGLLVQTGRCNVTAKDCVFQNNRHHGVFLGYDACGSVCLQANKLLNNGKMGLEDCTREGACKVELEDTLIEGNKEEHNIIKQKLAKKLAEEFPLKREDLQAAREEFRRETGLRPHFVKQQHTRTERARKTAGLCHGLPHCGFCNKEESENDKFSKCSTCKAVWYCSRKCQKAHWKTHKQECVEIADYPSFRNPAVGVAPDKSSKPSEKVPQVCKDAFNFGQSVTILKGRLSGQTGCVVGVRAGEHCRDVCVKVNTADVMCISALALCALDENVAQLTPPHPGDWVCVEFAGCPDVPGPWQFYAGQVLDGWPHGFGVLVFSDGGLHVGEFKHKESVGAGLHVFPGFFLMPCRVVLGNWRGNKPHSAAITVSGSHCTFCRYTDGSAYGTGWESERRLSFNSRPPVPMSTRCPELGSSMSEEVRSAAVVVQTVLKQSSFLAYQHTQVAAGRLREALDVLESREFV